MICPSCNSENNDGIKFCTNCGTKLMMNCPSCNALIKIGAKFCLECGNKLSGPAASENAGINISGKVIAGGDYNTTVNNTQQFNDNSVHNNQVYYGTQESNTTINSVNTNNATNNVNADEQYVELAKNLEQSGNLSEAEKYYTMAAELGNLEAIDALCNYYMSEECEDYDTNKRIKWNKVAMEKNIASGYLSMGYLYHYGDPDSEIEMNLEEAEKYYKKGAELGNETCSKMLKQVKPVSKAAPTNTANTQQQTNQFGGFSDIFDSVFAGGFGSTTTSSSNNQKQNTPTPGTDLNCTLTISPDDAAHGKTLDVSFSRTEVCGLCNGTGGSSGSLKQTCSVCNGAGQIIQGNGFFNIKTSCNNCKGDGFKWLHECERCNGNKFVQVKKVITLNIPAGVTGGKQLKVSGMGNCSLNGGPFGDLYISIQVVYDELPM